MKYYMLICNDLTMLGVAVGDTSGLDAIAITFTSFWPIFVKDFTGEFQFVYYSYSYVVPIFSN